MAVELKLPKIDQAHLNVQKIDWGNLPKRFLNEGELEVIVALMRSVNAARIVEFGTNEGRTAAAILRNVPTVREYIGVDVPPGYQFACAVQKAETPAQPGHLAASDARFKLILRPKGSLDLTVDDIGEVDAVFIDGDHSRAAVTHDSEFATKIVNKGGIIVWHDYHNLETVDVRPVLEEMQAAGRQILHVANTWIAFERW